jgi:hypothetical protein
VTALRSILHEYELATSQDLLSLAHWFAGQLKVPTQTAADYPVPHQQQQQHAVSGYSNSQGENPAESYSEEKHRKYLWMGSYGMMLSLWF